VKICFSNEGEMKTFLDEERLRKFVPSRSTAKPKMAEATGKKMIKDLHKSGRKEGRKKGRKEGREEGRKEGKEEGRKGGHGKYMRK
jgi:flagellar biosynthesis/type III secretory pathway protein FliH